MEKNQKNQNPEAWSEEAAQEAAEAAEAQDAAEEQAEETAEAATDEFDDAQPAEADAEASQPEDGEGQAEAAASPEEESLKMQLMRLQADFQNFKRRAERDHANTILYANESLVIQLLDVVDNFERALASEKEHDSFFEGMEMIHKQLVQVLHKNGVERIETDGEAFDPALHNAVMMEESDEVPSQHIIRTLQNGYRLHGKMIRPAMVTVAR